MSNPLPAEDHLTLVTLIYVIDGGRIEANRVTAEGRGQWRVRTYLNDYESGVTPYREHRMTSEHLDYYVKGFIMIEREMSDPDRNEEAC